MTGLTVIEPRRSLKLAVKLALKKGSTEQDRKDFAQALVEDAKAVAIRSLKSGGRDEGCQ